MVKLELLAPAKNYEYAVAAINAGADAIYIGAPNFGARSGATNSIDDIARVVEYAHLFGVRVYVALNTIIYDYELNEAEDIARKVVAAGCDALIVQDMAYRMMDLNIPLHLSTQGAANTPEMVRFMENSGFSRVILERFLSLEDIKEIRRETTVELETFVHGAICVGESGRCYMGQAISGRSGNRGVCSQLCRAKYTLKDENGNILLRDKHLLSLYDLNLSNYIKELAFTGVTSFKIEGRLKDLCYLKNSVAYYRSMIDDFIANNSGYCRSSQGRITFDFAPSPEKSFSRSFTNYFIEGDKYASKMASFATAKAVGEYIGVVEEVKGKGVIVVKSDKIFVGGDGVCFINSDKTFGGTNINSGINQGDKVYLTLNSGEDIKVGAKLFRNYNKVFNDIVLKAKTSRYIDVNIDLYFENSSLTVLATDVEGATAELEYKVSGDEVRDVEKMIDTIVKQMSKSGGTVFSVNGVSVSGKPYFIAVKELNGIRRELLKCLEVNRLRSYKIDNGVEVSYPAPYSENIDARANVTNRLSREFYQRCGFTSIDEGYDLRGVAKDAVLMECRYCLRREIGECLKKGGRVERLYLEGVKECFELVFDCKRCRMVIKKR